MDPELFKDPRFLRIYNDPQSRFARETIEKELRDQIAASAGPEGTSSEFSDEDIRNYVEDQVVQEAVRRFETVSGIGPARDFARIARDQSANLDIPDRAPAAREQLQRIQRLSAQAQAHGDESLQELDSPGETNRFARAGRIALSRGGNAATNIGRFFHRGGSNAFSPQSEPQLLPPEQGGPASSPGTGLAGFLEVDEAGDAADETGQFFRNIAPITEPESKTQAFLENFTGLAAETAPFIAGAAPGVGAARLVGRIGSGVGRSVGRQVAPGLTRAITSQPAGALARGAKEFVKAAPTEAAGAIAGLGTALPDDVFTGELDLGHAAPLMAALGVFGAGARGVGAARRGPSPEAFGAEARLVPEAEVAARRSGPQLRDPLEGGTRGGDPLNEPTFLRRGPQEPLAGERRGTGTDRRTVDEAFLGDRTGERRVLSREGPPTQGEGPQTINRGTTIRENLQIQLERARQLKERVDTIGDKRSAQAADDLLSGVEARLESVGERPLHNEPGASGEAGLKDLAEVLNPIIESLEKATALEKGGAPTTTGARFRGGKRDGPKGTRKKSRRGSRPARKDS